MIDQRRPSGKVTVEDLLRLKRAERPPVEFWADFDRTLHAKQLAAIVAKRPWWRRQTWAKATRWSLPLSAAAALTVAFATVGHPFLVRNRSTPAQPIAEKTPSVAIAAPIAPASLPQKVDAIAEVPSILVASIDRRTVPVFVAVSTPAVQPPAAPISHALSVPEQIAGLALTSESEQNSARFTTVSTKENLAMPELGGLFDKAIARLDITGTHPDRTNMIEPLAQVPTPREARRARLVALLSLPGYAEVDTSAGEQRTREHVASHFNDQALYDAISRLDVKGKRAAIQF